MEISQVWDRIKPHYIWYVVGVVAVLYVGSFLLTQFTVLVWLPEAMSQLAATIITGSIFASLLKAYQFSNLFRDELEKLFATDAFVDRLKAIVQHGATGDETLRNAFEAIAGKTHESLASRVPASMVSLLSVKTEYSFRNYKRYIKITGYAKSSQMITIQDEVEYELEVHADTTYKSGAGGAAFASQPKIHTYTLTERGQLLNDVSKQVQFGANEMSLSVPVVRGKTYTLHRVVEMKFELFKDPNIHQQFQRFCDGLQVEIENQISAQVSFTLQWINFSDEPKAYPRKEGGSTVCRYQNHGLTFPYQGFILTMSPNK